ncbi:hypothetical protein ElyMa_001130900 [Elysia marginata]|uniref:Uncharacterized protein n=1 Tax=Elysia marginata TaxID=1093978 RepID=A0AAV4HYQ0_9GAST|nr:hypothetical protein ElyMa_001130900 [Elysia marginata]
MSLMTRHKMEDNGNMGFGNDSTELPLSVKIFTVQVPSDFYCVKTLQSSAFQKMLWCDEDGELIDAVQKLFKNLHGPSTPLKDNESILTGLRQKVAKLETLLTIELVSVWFFLLDKHATETRKRKICADMAHENIL